MSERACVDLLLNLSCSNCGTKLHVGVDGNFSDSGIELSFKPCDCADMARASEVQS